MNSLQPTQSIQAPGERNWLGSTAAYYAAFIGLGFTTASLGPLLPLLADQTHTALDQVSILFTTRWLGYLIGSLVIGRVYDRRGGHPVMAIALLAIAACMALTPVIPALWGLALIMLVLGGAESSLDVGGNTLLIWLHGRRVAPFMNGLHFFYGLGALLSPLIIAQSVLLTGRSAWALWLVALLIVPLAFSLLRLPSPVAHIPEPSGVDADAGPDARRHNTDRTRWTVVFLFVLFFMTAIGAEQSFGGWIYTFSVAAGLVSFQTAAYLTSAFWGAFTLSRLASISLANRLSTRAYLIISLAGCAIGLGLLNALGFMDTVSTAQAALWLGTLLFGISIAVVFPITMSYAGERIPIVGQITSLFFVGVSAGGMLIPWLIGQFFESISPYAAMFIILLAILSSIVTFVLIDRLTRRAKT